MRLCAGQVAKLNAQKIELVDKLAKATNENMCADPSLPLPSLCCAVLCCAVLCCAVLCCAVLCCAVLCCAVCRLRLPHW
jgi:hypothetical protein